MSVSTVCARFYLLQDLLQSCARGGGRRVEDMSYERRRAEACVDESAHHALVNAGGRLRLTRNAAALAAASPTLLFRPL
jgi:hypothetical protein